MFSDLSFALPGFLFFSPEGGVDGRQTQGTWVCVAVPAPSPELHLGSRGLLGPPSPARAPGTSALGPAAASGPKQPLGGARVCPSY